LFSDIVIDDYMCVMGNANAADEISFVQDGERAEGSCRTRDWFRQLYPSHDPSTTIHNELLTVCIVLVVMNAVER